MTEKLWKVVGVVHHDDGRTTLTLRDEHGTTKTEDYAPGTMMTRVVRKDKP